MTRTRYGVSPWIEEFPRRRRPDYPRFRGESACPVAIIGGGLTGILTAYAFAAAGIKVAVLEADRLGQGGSSRGPGVLQGEAAFSYRDVESRHGRRAARALFDASRRAVLDLAAAARRIGARHVATHDALRIVASLNGDESRLMKEAAARRDAGLDAVWLKAAAAVRDSRVEQARAGIRVHQWGSANPYALLVAFARAAEARGAEIFERSEVRRVKNRRAWVDLHTRDGVLAAGTVVVCTGEPTELYRPLRRHVRLDERYVAVTGKLPAAVRRQIAASVPVLTDTDAPPHTVRWLDDGRLVIAGADQPRTPPRGRPQVVVQRTGQLMYELLRLYPAISGTMPAYGWDLSIGTAADGVMYAGPHRNYPRHLFAWATRHDPSQAFLASRILLRHYLGEADRADAFFAFTRG